MKHSKLLIALAMTGALSLGLTAYAQTSTKPKHTFANPLDVLVGHERGVRGGEPVVLIYKDDYYLFVSHRRGYWYSPDFQNWTYVDAPNYPAGVVSVVEFQGELIGCSMNNRNVYKAIDPKAGTWEKIGELSSDRYGDANLFADGDRLYLYFGWSQIMPFQVVELDTKTFKEKAEPIPLFFSDIKNHGFEARKPEDVIYSIFGGRRDYGPEEFPWIEGPWMTKHNGKYYLQYAAIGLEFISYSHGVYVSDSPTGPFVYSEHNPLTFKTSGFEVGAGHGSTFHDKKGNLWTICMIPAHYGENGRGSELAIFPTAVDKDGVMYSDTAYGDYPQYFPNDRKVGGADNYTDWKLLSYKKRTEVSSTAANHPAVNALDEDFLTCWAAETSNPGEYFMVDLGGEASINAIQLNWDQVRAPQATTGGNRPAGQGAGGAGGMGAMGGFGGFGGGAPAGGAPAGGFGGFGGFGGGAPGAGAAPGGAPAGGFGGFGGFGGGAPGAGAGAAPAGGAPAGGFGGFGGFGGGAPGAGAAPAGGFGGFGGGAAPAGGAAGGQVGQNRPRPQGQGAGGAPAGGMGGFGGGMGGFGGGMGGMFGGGRSTGPDTRYQCYKVEVSTDGTNWTTVIDKPENNLELKHDYNEFEKPVKARYVKVTNIATYDNSLFAIKDLRIFGTTDKMKTTKVTDFKAVRNPDDLREANLLWTPVEGADGYVVRYGIEPNKLYNSYIVYGDNKLYMHSLNTAPEKYYFEVEAFSSGLPQYRENPLATIGTGAELQLGGGRGGGMGGFSSYNQAGNTIVMLKEGVDEYVFEDITPGNWNLTHSYGPNLWRGELTEKELISNEDNPKATLDVPLTKLGVGTKVTGTLRMKVIPGKENGKIVVYIDKK
jgi:hypothetical protein